jgi:hypothetical protein
MKSQLIGEFGAYPDKLEAEVVEQIQVNMESVKAKANESVQKIVATIMDRTEKELQVRGIDLYSLDPTKFNLYFPDQAKLSIFQEKLRRKTELHALDTERQIQADLLERAKQKHEKCLQKLEQILHNGEERFKELAADRGWSSSMIIE